jgi:hypothetical protein
VPVARPASKTARFLALLAAIAIAAAAWGVGSAAVLAVQDALLGTLAVNGLAVGHGREAVVVLECCAPEGGVALGKAQNDGVDLAW